MSRAVELLDDDDYRALDAFRARLRRFLAFSEAQAREVGLTPQQHQLLLAVRAAGSPGPTIGALAERLLLRHHSTVELVNRLEERKLIRRVQSETDRRRAHVAVTARGEKLLGGLSLTHREELRRAAPDLVAALRALQESS
jgi:DNA-binding MarR family transcriptional regulator